MKTPKLVLIVLTIFLLASCSPEEDGINFTNSNSNETTVLKKQNYSAIELEILDLVNLHRNSIGLNSLNKCDITSFVSLSHTDYMIEKNEINHDNFGVRFEKLKKDANAKTVGENVAYGYNSAKSVVNGWLNSESHRALIENENFTHFGISVENNDDGRNYFTQMFIKC